MQYVHVVQWADAATREGGLVAIFADDQEAEAKAYAAEEERRSGTDCFVERWALGPRRAE